MRHCLIVPAYLVMSDAWVLTPDTAVVFVAHNVQLGTARDIPQSSTCIDMLLRMASHIVSLQRLPKAISAAERTRGHSSRRRTTTTRQRPKVVLRFQIHGAVVLETEAPLLRA